MTYGVAPEIWHPREKERGFFLSKVSLACQQRVDEGPRQEVTCSGLRRTVTVLPKWLCF